MDRQPMLQRFLPTVLSRPGLAATAGLTLLTLAGPVHASTPATWWVAPNGTGSACVQSAPCASLATAFYRAHSGDVINLEAGSYPGQVLGDNYPAAASFSSNVVIQPAPGANVTLGGLDIYPPHVTVRGLRFTGQLIDRDMAGYAQFDSLTMDGVSAPNAGVVWIFGSHVSLTNSTIVNSVDADGVDVGQGGTSLTDVTIAHNRIGNLPVGPLQNHVDCIQLPGNDDNIRILANVLWGCANSEIISKPDVGPISNVLIENNFIQGCVQQTPACNGYYAVYLRTAGNPMSNLSFVHNTVDGGMSVDGADLPNFLMAGNIMAANYSCGPFEDWNLVAAPAAWTSCATPSAHDRVGSPTYVNRATRDFHLAAGSLGIGFGDPYAPATDIDGRPRNSPADVGASQFYRPPPAAPAAAGPAAAAHAQPAPHSTPQPATQSPPPPVSTPDAPPGTPEREETSKSGPPAATPASASILKDRLVGGRWLLTFAMSELVAISVFLRVHLRRMRRLTALRSR